MCRCEEIYLYWRRLIDTQKAKIVEIALCNSTVVQRDSLPQRRTDTVENCALYLRFGARRIDYLAADITDHPNLVDSDHAGGGHGRLHDFCEISEVAVIERNAKARSFR